MLLLVSPGGVGATVVAITIVSSCLNLVGVSSPVTFVATITVLFLSTYIGWQALEGNPKYSLVRSFAIACAAFRGTNFLGADLTNATFYQARFKNVDLRDAVLTHTYWQNTQTLGWIRPGNTYLKDAQVRKLVMTGDGKNQNFDRQDLRGINLQGANFRACQLYRHRSQLIKFK